MPLRRLVFEMLGRLGVAVHGKIHNALRCGGGLADVCDGGGHNLEEDHKGLA